ncbi:MAG TPA: decaprenyl-phosphate phosphoribosyltransferase [Candidatus Eisenbacteria bacterium]|nr:decaprenyl-phosphate phosphoribosyltransferase [Candidatus Eisenbacteria bacterium]
MDEPRRSAFGVAFDLLRCSQWVKNVFVFGALVFGNALLVPEKAKAALLAFVLFCAVTSAAYIHNDVSDLEIDRLHPRKRMRPLAAGIVSVATARVVQAALLVVGVGGAALFLPRILPLLIGYVLLNVLYSGVLKQLLLLDVMAIAVGFVIRVEAGCEAVEIDPSVWIVLCTFVLALFLALGKRRHELLEMAAVGAVNGGNGRATYTTEFLEQTMTIASAVTIVCYAMFSRAPETLEVHGTRSLIYTIPFVVYGLFRYQWLTYDGEGRGDPGEIVFTDRPLQATIALWIAACVAIVYLKW